jgi:16S rRNA (cytosine967-C5)-methyltransferase
MRVHRPLATAAEAILDEVFARGRVLDRAVAAAFRANRRWGKRDRSFVAESVWETVRWRRALARVAGSDETPALLAAAWWRAGYEIPDWWAGPGAPVAEFAAREAGLAACPRAVRESLPDWLDRRGEAELGARWDPLLGALNTRAPVFLRVNRLRATRDEVLGWLADEGVAASAVEGLPDGVVLEGTLPKRLAADPRIAFQDGGSQRVVPAMDVGPGMRVIDACAGAGGKTLHLAAEMRGRGELVALDIHEGKLDELRKRAARAGVENLRVESWSSASDARWRGRADRVLIDAPCSGLGTLRRQPDLKWRLDDARIEFVRATQRELLDRAAAWVKPGGCLTYATCSVLPSENREPIERFLADDPDWELRREERIDPEPGGFDGFYVATLGR